MMNICATAGFRSAGSFSVSCAPVSIFSNADASHFGFPQMCAPRLSAAAMVTESSQQTIRPRTTEITDLGKKNPPEVDIDLLSDRPKIRITRTTEVAGEFNLRR
jgi:hypothetical protein